jgi:hypothetical protein
MLSRKGPKRDQRLETGNSEQASEWEEGINEVDEGL